MRKYRQNERTLIPVLLTGFLFLSGFGFARQTAFSSAYEKQGIRLIDSQTLHIETPEISFETLVIDGNDYQRPLIDGVGSNAEIGDWDLPTISTYFAVEPGKSYTANITILESESVPGIELPTKTSWQDPNNPQTISKTLSADGSTPSFEPELLPGVEVSEPQVMRDMVLVQVSYTPFVYHPESNELDVITSTDIELVESNANNVIPSDLPPRLSRAFEPLYQSLIPNYSDRTENAEYQPHSILYILPSNSATVLPLLQPLLDWRTRLGYVVNTVSTSETGSSTTSIKNYIIDAYNEWDFPPEFVVLVGDANGTYFIPTYFENWSFYNGEGDHPYSTLAGGDRLPEVLVGRLTFSSTTELATIVNKIIQYESNPYTGNTEWFTRACLVGDPGYSGISTIITNQQIGERMVYQGYSGNIEIYSSPFASQMVSGINDGVSYINYRGWLGVSDFDNYDVNSLNNGWMLPFATIITCRTGSFSASGVEIVEAFIRAGTPSQPKGAIAAVGTATIGTHTMFNNAVDLGIYQGLFAEGMTSAGAALYRGKLNLQIQYPDNPSNYVDIFTHWHSLMGDPSTQLWTGFPQTLNVTHPVVITKGTNMMDILVEDDDENPVENAWVTLWRAESDTIFESGYTNQEGLVSLPITSTIPGGVKVTVSKHNYKPYQGLFSISDPQLNVNVIPEGIVIDDDTSGLSNGNNDQALNSGETIELMVPFYNYGSDSIFTVSGILQSTQPHVIVIQDSCYVGALDTAEMAYGNTPFLIHLDNGFEDGQPLGLRMDISDSQGNQFVGALHLVATGTKLNVKDTHIIDLGNGNDVLDPGETAALEITLSNDGSVTASNVTGTLYSTTTMLTVDQNIGNFGDVAPGELANNGDSNFQLEADDSILPGTIITLYLALNGSNGIQKTEYVSLQIGIPDETDPVGPDSYGYYIYANNDDMYSNSPQYEWIEIDDRYGGSGTNIGIYDSGDDQDDVTSVDLPFTFRMYGEEYDKISICSNGWIAMGDTPLRSFRNYQIPGAGGPNPMIAAFWDDLTTNSGGRVYTYYDSDGHRFIVEWSNMTTYQQSSNEDFQVILHDPAYYLTPTNDGEILIQYKTFNNTSYNTGSSTTHGKYCTVGIEDQSATIGLEYTFNNQYHPAAMPLENQSALFITTRGGSVRVFGDVNQDNTLDVLDLVTLATYLQDNDSSQLSLYLADINSDGAVDIIDLINMFQDILEQ